MIKTLIPVRSHIVSGVLLSRQDGEIKILLMKRVKGNFWCHIAGKVETAETAVQAIVREIKEETQVQVSELYSADYLEQFYEADQNVIEMIPVFLVYCTEHQQIVLNDEHSEYAWFSLQEAIEKAEFGGQRLLYQYIWDNFVHRKPSELLKIQLF